MEFEDDTKDLLKVRNVIFRIDSKNGKQVNISSWIKRQIKNNKTLKQFVLSKGWNIPYSDDERILLILKWIRKNFVYTKEKSEYWQTANESFDRMKGDCEDGAIFLMVLFATAGGNMKRIMLEWGYVLGGGHAYIKYRNDNALRVIVDWCYWYTPLIMKARKWFKLETKYISIWGNAYVE